jgi:hypothetical protein
MEPAHHKSLFGRTRDLVSLIVRMLRMWLGMCALLCGCTSLGPTAIIADPLLASTRRKEQRDHH